MKIFEFQVVCRRIKYIRSGDEVMKFHDDSFEELFSGFEIDSEQLALMEKCFIQMAHSFKKKIETKLLTVDPPTDIQNNHGGTDND